VPTVTLVFLFCLSITSVSIIVEFSRNYKPLLLGLLPRLAKMPKL
jgi:hypothetical protein